MFFDDINNLVNVKMCNPTAANRLKMNGYAWGAVSGFHLEQVKVCSRGGTASSALLKISDSSGCACLLLEGSRIGILFGVTPDKWKAIEDLATIGEDLFYRPFPMAIRESFSVQERLFYHFCATNQTRDVFFAYFQRSPNFLRREQAVPFLRVLETSRSQVRIKKIYREKILNSSVDEGKVQFSDS